MWSEVEWCGVNWRDFCEVIFSSEVKWCEVQRCGVNWRDLCEVILFSSKVKWSGVTVTFLGTKVPYTLRWNYTDGTWLYCDYFIWCVSCTVVVLTGFVMCRCVYGVCVCVCVGFVMCGCVCVCVCVWCVCVGFVMCRCVCVCLCVWAL